MNMQSLRRMGGNKMKTAKVVFFLCLCVGLSSVALADVSGTTTFNSTNLPVAGAGWTVVASGGNMVLTNTAGTGTPPPGTITLVSGATAGLGSYKVTASFPSAVGVTTGFVGFDAVPPPASGSVAANIGATTVDLAFPGTTPTLFGSVARPAGAFRMQLEKILTGATRSQFILRVDANNDGDFADTGEIIGPGPDLGNIQRAISWAATSTTAITVSSIVVEPGIQRAPQATPSASAPTMGSWGAIVMALVLLVIAGMAIRAKKTSA